MAPTGSGTQLSKGYLVAICVGAVSLFAVVLISLFATSRHRQHQQLKAVIRGQPSPRSGTREPAEDKATDITASLMVYSPVFRLNKGTSGSEEGSKKASRVSRSSNERTAMAPMQPKSSRHLLGVSTRGSSGRGQQSNEREIQLVVKRNATFVNPLLQLSSSQGSVPRQPERQQAV